MPISHKIRQYRALLGFVHLGEVPWPAEQGPGSRTQAGNMAGFYAPNSGWLSSWGLGIGLLEQSRSPLLVVPWFDVSRLFWVVVRLPFCPTPPILTVLFCTFLPFSLTLFLILLKAELLV